MAEDDAVMRNADADTDRGSAPVGVMDVGTEAAADAVDGLIGDRPRLDAAMHTVFAAQPWAIGFSVTERSSESIVYLVLESDDAEDDAYALWGSVRRLVGSEPLTLVCLPRTEADALELSAYARAYAFR